MMTPKRWGMVSYCGIAGIVTWVASGPFPGAVPWIAGGAVVVGAGSIGIGWVVGKVRERILERAARDWP